MADSGRYIVDEVTPLTPAAVIEALYRGFGAVVGRVPEAPELCCHVGQWALETGHGKSCHRNNLGNLKATESYTGLVTYFGCNEVLSGKVKWFHPDLSRCWPWHMAWITAHTTSVSCDNQCRWKAFETLSDGAAAQLRFFQRRPRSFTAALSGNPRTFAHALKLDRYYTAHEEDYYVGGKLVWGYAHTLESVFHKYLPACVAACKELVVAEPPAPPTLPELPHPEEPDVDQPRAERLDQEHLDKALELLRDIVIEIPWGDYDSARRSAVAELNERDYD
jgi:hypothetical protein